VTWIAILNQSFLQFAPAFLTEGLSFASAQDVLFRQLDEARRYICSNNSGTTTCKYSGHITIATSRIQNGQAGYLPDKLNQIWKHQMVVRRKFPSLGSSTILAYSSANWSYALL
jgi:hypothetical protein